VAQRLGRGIALLFHDRCTRRGEWSAAGPDRTLPPGKTRYPLYRRLGGPQGRSGRAENLAPPGYDPRTVQPIVAIPTELPGPLPVVGLLKSKVVSSVLFSVQRDESTDVSNLALLVVYITNAVTLWKLSYSFWCATLRKLPRLQDTFLKKCYVCVYNIALIGKTGVKFALGEPSLYWDAELRILSNAECVQRV